jgi:hypothetical protein
MLAEEESVHYYAFVRNGVLAVSKIGNPIILRMRNKTLERYPHAVKLPHDLNLLAYDIDGMDKGGVLSPEDKISLKKLLNERVKQVFGKKIFSIPNNDICCDFIDIDKAEKELCSGTSVSFKLVCAHGPNGWPTVDFVGPINDLLIVVKRYCNDEEEAKSLLKGVAQ